MEDLPKNLRRYSDAPPPFPSKGKPITRAEIDALQAHWDALPQEQPWPIGRAVWLVVLVDTALWLAIAAAAYLMWAIFA